MRGHTLSRYPSDHNRAAAGSDDFGWHFRLDGEGQRHRVIGGPSENRPWSEELRRDAVIEADAARDPRHVGVETLASDRTSCRSALANQVRLVLLTAAY
jgi:hypothetical protein